MNYPAQSNYVKHTDNPTSVQAMRRACHNILYTIVNSRAYAEDSATPGMASWVIVAIIADVLLLALFAFLEYRVIRRYKKNK